MRLTLRQHAAERKEEKYEELVTGAYNTGYEAERITLEIGSRGVINPAGFQLLKSTWTVQVGRYQTWCFNLVNESLKALTASGALETDLSSKLSICSLVCMCISTSVSYLFLFFMAVVAQLLCAVQLSCTSTFTLEYAIPSLCIPCMWNSMKVLLWMRERDRERESPDSQWVSCNL